MSNKRTKRKARSGPARAPRDASALPDEADASSPERARSALVFSTLKIIAGVALVLGAAVAIAWGAHRYALTTPRFAIKDLVVEGARRLTRQQVLDLAGVQSGQNVFSLDVEQAERALLTNPWVQSVRIARRLPGEVRIELRERQPRALAVIGPRTLLVSDDAVPFKPLEAGDPHDLPLITGLDAQGFATDQKAELGRLESALALLDGYGHLPLSQAYPAEEVHLDERGHAVLTIGSQGTALHLGPGPWKQKLLRAARVLGKSQAGGVLPGVVFLDNEAHPERVVVRVK